MANVKVKIPKLGLTTEEVTLSAWLKGQGDAVQAGEIIATIEADKSSFEVESPVTGVVKQILFEPSEDALLPVGTEIAIIEV